LKDSKFTQEPTFKALLFLKSIYWKSSRFISKVPEMQELEEASKSEVHFEIASPRFAFAD
jgi:hypothetical protein